MQKHSHKFLKMSVALIAASTLLAVGSPIQAAPVNAQVKVTSHLDTNEKTRTIIRLGESQEISSRHSRPTLRHQ